MIRAKFILNPNAGLGRAGQLEEILRPIAESYGEVDWVNTKFPGHALELVRKIPPHQFDHIVAVGGDGTVHEIVNGLMKFNPEERPILGVVPAGSGNDFSYAVGINSQPETAVKKIFNGSIRKVDLGLLEDDRGNRRYWINAVGIGFDTTVTIRSRQFKKFRGFFAYLMAVFQTIILDHDAPFIDVETDTETWGKETMLLVLSNGPREGGGFLVSPGAQPDDGLFNYAQISKVSRPRMFRLLPEVINGTHGKFPEVHMGTFTKMSLQSKGALYIHLDGEIFAGFGEDVRQLNIGILKNEIRIVC